MLTKEGCLARRARLWDAVPKDCEWLLVADPRVPGIFEVSAEGKVTRVEFSGE